LAEVLQDCAEFEEGTGRIEIVRDNKLERIYFRVPSLCHNLTKDSKDDLLINVKRDNQQDKIEDFFDRSDFLMQVRSTVGGV
jgi:hypothetical protein